MRHLTARRKRQLVLLFALMLAGAFAELLSLGAVIPFVTVLANPTHAAAVPAISRFMEVAGIAPAQLPVAISLIFGGLVLMAAGIRLALMWATIRFANGLGTEIGCKLYERTLSRPYDFHVSRNTSEIIGSMNKIQRLTGGYVLPLLNAVIGGILAVAIIATLVAIQPMVALAGAGLFGGSYFLIAASVRKRLRRSGGVIARGNDQRIQALQEGLGGIRDVILDQAQPIYTRRFARIEERFRQAQATSQFYGSFPRVAIEAVGMLMLSGFALYFSNSSNGLGNLLPLLGVIAVGAQKLMPLVQQIYTGWSSALGSVPSVNNVLDLLDFEPDRSLATGSIAFEREMRLEGVSFHYSTAANAAPVLHELDLTVRRSEKIGIVGATGSGKSTLVDLMMGLLTPTDGRFSVDGVEVTPRNAAAWQRRIAHVPQSIFLSDASVAENIAFGVDPEHIDLACVETAARVAQIHDHIVSLPQGYATSVGERGVRLSGGQRQRIGIARALYKQVDVLVLDEATSALDDETERRVMNAITQMSASMTVIMIAHRITTMRNCDRILEMQRGRIRSWIGYEELLGRQNELQTHG